MKKNRGNIKHGMGRRGKRARLYTIWIGIRGRCNRPSDNSYKYYGGRGIKVCDRWENSFENFRDDMLPGYRDDLILGRYYINGDYTPENCRWIPHREAMQYRRYSHFYNGKNIAQWAKELGVTHSRLSYLRIKNGNNLEEAVNKILEEAIRKIKV